MNPEIGKAASTGLQPASVSPVARFLCDAEEAVASARIPPRFIVEHVAVGWVECVASDRCEIVRFDHDPQECSVELIDTSLITSAGLSRSGMAFALLTTRREADSFVVLVALPFRDADLFLPDQQGRYVPNEPVWKAILSGAREILPKDPPHL